MFNLTPKQSKFARLYFETGNASKSYRDSYDAELMTDNSVRVAASDLLQHPTIIEYIDDMRDNAEAMSQLSVSWLINQHMRIATADVNELVESRRVCCRHCHGIDHKYQWIDADEWALKLTEVMETNARTERRNAKLKGDDEPAPVYELPTLDGGIGFWGTKAPVATCPHCFGNGEQLAHIHDTRKLSKAGKLLYQGIKQTANGFEIKIRDQAGSMDWLAKYLGLDKKSLELSGPGGGPINMTNLKAEDLTDDQLAALIAQEKPTSDNAE